MCTNFRLTAVDGSVVTGRTMDSPSDMGARLAVLPRGFRATSIGPDGAGATWTSRHGVVGMDVFGHPSMLVDGMNDAGLSAALLLMPTFCEYTDPAAAEPETHVSVAHVIALLLGTTSTVAEAIASLEGLTVWAAPIHELGAAPPARIALHDAGGVSVVAEWRDGRMSVTQNPIGVATNSPHLDWHLTNLRNYLNLTPENPPHRAVAGVELHPMCQGPGMAGVPGDASSPSRYVRAVAITSSLRPVADAAGLELAALHVLNNFDIPWGYVRKDDDPAWDDHTRWSTVANVSQGRYVVRTYDDPVPRVVELDRLDLDAEGATTVELGTGGPVPLMI